MIQFTFDSKISKIYLLIFSLVLFVSSGCKSQISNGQADRSKYLFPSLISLMKYCDSHMDQLSSDSLIYYTDSIWRYSYYNDTSGLKFNSLLSKLSEEALKKDKSSKKAAQRVLSLSLLEKRYEKALDISNHYFNDSSDLVHLLSKSMIYWRIGDNGNADKGFRFIKSKCERILQLDPNLKKENYLGNMWMLGLTSFILDGKEKALIRMREMTDKYPDDKFVNGLFEKVENYSNADELIKNNLP